MKKIFILCFASVLIFLASTIVVAETMQDNGLVLAKQTEVNSFELFWPIVAGKTMGDRFYSLKLFKERVRGAFILSSFKKADYRITISEKRLVEAESLFKSGDYADADKTLDLTVACWEDVKKLITQSDSSGMITANLRSRFEVSLEKQGLVLNSLLTKVPDGEKVIIQKAVDKAKEISKI